MWTLTDREFFEKLQVLTDVEPFGDALDRRFQTEVPSPKELYEITFGRSDRGGHAFKVVLRGEQIEKEKHFDPSGWNDFSKVLPRPDPKLIYQLEIERHDKTECYAATWNQHTRGWRQASDGRLIRTIGAQQINFKEWRKK